MSRKPKNIQWCVIGNAVHIGASVIVHAETRAEAMRKAAAGEHIGRINLGDAVDTDFQSVDAEICIGED